MTEYKILQSSPGQADVLADIVQAHINEGWELNGALHCATVDKYNVLIQAMVKHAS